MKYLNLILVFVFLAFSVKSDQLDSRLTNLFQELYNSTDESQSNQIVEKIWDIWLETNDTEIEKDFYRGVEFLRIGDYTQSIYFLTQVIKKNPNFCIKKRNKKSLSKICKKHNCKTIKKKFWI